MKAYQIMEAILEELDKRTKNEKGEEATRKRSDHGASYRDYINYKELYPHNQGITGNEEKDLKREAKGLYKAIDHYNTWNKEHGYNPHPGSYITGLKCDLAKVKNTLRHINNYKRYSKASEALDIMEEILVEASPLEVKRRIANKFKDKIGGMYNKAVEDDRKNSEEKMNLHNKIHGEGGNTVVVMGDKIENFSDNPEIRKDQEKFNEVTDKSKKSGEKVYKLGNLKNLVDYYKNEALELTEAKKFSLKEAMELLEDIHAMIDKHGDKIGPKSELHDLMRTAQREAAIQYAEEKGKPWGKRWEDETDFENRRKGEDTKNYKGQRKTTEKQFKGFGTVTVGGDEPTELDKKIRREHAKKDGKPVQDYPFDDDIEDYTRSGSKPQKIIDKSIARHEKKEQKKTPIKEAMELAEAIINEFTEADKKEAAKKVLKDRKRKYLDKHKEYKEMDRAGVADLETVYNDAVAKERYDHAKKVANEAFSLAESIIGYADNIFELDYENKQNVNTNKIRKLKKDKDGENVEVVSVADELFPYEGNAKQQFNQKVLAKINDMIEGKGSLEDLIQFVRKYSGNKKGGNEKLHEAIELMEDIESYARKTGKWNKKLDRKLQRAKSKEFSKAVDVEYKRAVDDSNKLIPHLGDTIDRWEIAKNIANRRSTKDDREKLEKAFTDGIKKLKSQNRLVNFQEKTHEPIGTLKEALEEIKQVVEGLFVNDGRGDLLQDVDRATGSHGQKAINKGVAALTGTREAKIAKVKSPSPEIKNKQIGMNVHKDKSLMPKPTLKNMYKQAEVNRMNTFENLENLNVSEECLDDILSIIEGLFVKDGRGDLLNDIDNALGSPVKKTAKDMVKQCTGCKQKKVNEAVELMEEIINEVSVSRWKEAAANSIEGRKAKKDSNEDDYYAFSGKIPRDMQKQLDKEHAERDSYNSDRVSRAEYLAKNLPDSKKSASKVLQAAKDAVKTRSSKVDKIASDIDKKNKKEVPLMKATIGKDGKEFDKYANKHNERAKNFLVTSDREKHARIMANEPVRTYDDDKIKPEKGLYAQNSTSYKEDHKNRVSNLENAERVASKAYNKYIDNPTLDNEEKAKEANAKFKHAEKQYKDSKLSHKV